MRAGEQIAAAGVHERHDAAGEAHGQAPLRYCAEPGASATSLGRGPDPNEWALGLTRDGATVERIATLISQDSAWVGNEAAREPVTDVNLDGTFAQQLEQMRQAVLSHR